ncbi:broad substrate specificity ATP-binding cassette transporter [Chloropicon roscoffensis]|uniref:Broad substrate specificity ATP-binding cassette transporter n=1 Tax=Chloropicon roscoffensis TaxID=1461544 RepID=A0AAX4PEJ2_9CHLO
MSNGTMATEEPASEDSSANASRRLSPKEGRSPTFFTADDSSRGQEGIRLVVYDVSCRIGKKDTLKEVTGVVEPGEFYGVMGPSGAGKTMLMDIVCFRKSLGKVKGCVLYNGKQPTKDFVAHNVAYVEQQITVQPAFTVEEAIMFSAMLKRPRNRFTREEIEKTVDHVIEQLGLQKIRKSRVGNSRLVRGISGGEARRVSIGISLVQLTRPGLLCLDEPTTGLDSAIGNDILKLIRGCADEGWTIFTTIHNPSVMMMDHIDGLVLVVSSRIIWFGPYDHEAIKRDFECHAFHCEKSQHVVEYLLQVVGGGSRGSNEETLARACAAYEGSEGCTENRDRAVRYAEEAGLVGLCSEWRRPKRAVKLEGGGAQHEERGEAPGDLQPRELPPGREDLLQLDLPGDRHSAQVQDLHNAQRPQLRAEQVAALRLAVTGLCDLLGQPVQEHERPDRHHRRPLRDTHHAEPPLWPLYPGALRAEGRLHQGVSRRLLPHLLVLLLRFSHRGRTCGRGRDPVQLHHLLCPRDLPADRRALLLLPAHGVGGCAQLGPLC